MNPLLDPDPEALTEPCVLIGAGGHARVVAASLTAGRIVAVLEQDPARIGQTFGGLTIALDGGEPRFERLHLAIGDNAARRRLAGARPGARWLTIRHPQALIASDATLGEGAFIALGAAIQTGARIGDQTIVNTAAVVDHDGRIGAFCHIAPGAVLTGGVTLGDGVLVGAGAVILPGLSVGDGAVIGAGAVVTRSVAAGTTVAGVPARPV